MSDCSNHRSSTKKRVALKLSILISTCIFFSIVISLFSYDFVLNPELISVIEVFPENFPQGIYGEEWHTVYEEYGLYPGTWIHPHEYYRLYSDGWPEMDLQQYTYIITYCQEIESFSYNLGDVIDSPSYVGAKAGHMVLKDTIDPFKIYIYRIPRIRINNPNI